MNTHDPYKLLPRRIRQRRFAAGRQKQFALGNVTDAPRGRGLSSLRHRSRIHVLADYESMSSSSFFADTIRLATFTQ